MKLRIQIENDEVERLSPYAAKSNESLGRQIFEEKCELRTEYQRDRDRIIHSKSFRRLKHKTQVFLAPQGDHFRTRLTHTLEVSQISRTIARALNLNEDLTEAIALGHDLGHTPFGHSGEKFLDELHKNGFKHNEQSLRVVDVLEKETKNRSLNLTHEVRDGILHHTGSEKPCTLEGQIVKISDRIAYINHDIDDALRAGILDEKELPHDCLEALGETKSNRINNMVIDIVKNSDNENDIKMSDEYLFYMNKLRKYMFDQVYYNEKVKAKEEMRKIEHIIESLYHFYCNNFDRLPFEYKEMIKDWDKEEIVKDMIAGMTDRYAISVYTDLFLPKTWKL